MHSRSIHKKRTRQKRPNESAERRNQRTHPSHRTRTHPLQRLQQTHGNQVVQRLAQESIQPKLEVGPRNDRYEREAERVARAVTTASSSLSDGTRTTGPHGRVQRMCPRCQKRHAQGKPLDCPECEAELQRAATTATTSAVDTETASLIQESRSGGQPLPDAVRTEFEPRFGRDFGTVRVHTGRRADEAARAVDAQAFTLGRDIVLRSDTYRPEKSDGRRLLAHELTHVVQQDASDTRIQRANGTGEDPAAPAQMPATGPRIDVNMDESSGRISIEVEGTIVAEAQPTAGRDVSLQVDSQWDAGTNSLEVSVVAGPGVDVAMVPGGIEALGERFSSVSVNVTDTVEPIEPEPIREQPFNLESGQVGPIAGELPVPEPVLEPEPKPEPETEAEVPESTPAKAEESDSGGILTTLGDIATDFIPGVSNVKDVYTALTGENPVTGEKVGVLGRIASGIFAIPGVGNVAKYVGKGGKLVVKGIVGAGRKIAKSRLGRWVGKKASRGWDWLKKKVGLGPPPRRGCFVAGTLVETPDGKRAIETLRPGDVIRTYDPISNQRSDREVVRRFIHTAPSLVTIQIGTMTISCSPEHPFWVPGTGWQEAGALRSGDQLLTGEGETTRIESLQRVRDSATVYNIEVAEPHTYLVSDRGVLVHNKSMEVPKPVGSLKKPKANWLKKQGVDPHTVKEALPGPASRYDIYIDRTRNLFAKRKGAPDDEAEWLGHLDDFKS
ncbi:DUF4157 domain-containing protein [Halobium salinum]|uniref:DUF4157 domain-containing protein n=1 Tax=Halobium salinum TaxID=1364940 RepID=A0ABD5PI95_9EURY|nr:DUF4157 domain-containing protein [Halobium salinum]